MKELLQYVVAQMVDNPDSIAITEVERDGRVIYELRVASGDVGRVIGRGGSVAKDLRTLIKASSTDGRKVAVDIIDG